MQAQGPGVSSEVLVFPVLEHPAAGGHSDQQAVGEEAVPSQKQQIAVDDAPSRQAQTCRPEAADGIIATRPSRLGIMPLPPVPSVE